MPTRSIPILPDHYYHIYNRGNNKQRIFREKENFKFFLRQYRKYFSNAPVKLIAYCLMPNHFHLLLHIVEAFDFSRLVRSFSVSYVKSFHSWHKTSGHLFEDDYQAKPIKDDSHLIKVIPYIHSNPVIAGLVCKPQEWEFSDCRRWCEEESEFRGSELRSHLYGGPEGYTKYLVDFIRDKTEIQEVETRLLGKKSDI